MEREGLITPILLLAAIQAAAQSTERAAVRAALNEVYTKWGSARTGLDRSVVENTLEPDFYVILPDGKHTRQ